MTKPLLDVSHAETSIRLRNYDRLRLPTDCSSGKLTREQRQLIGVFGEVAFRVLCDDPPVEPWSTTGLDGGSDYTLYDGRTVQVMTACGSVCRYCYFPDFKPLKADVIVQARFIAKPMGIAFMGSITRQEFYAKAKQRVIGNREYCSIYVHEMVTLEDKGDPA